MDGIDYFFDEQVGNQARIKGPGTDRDQLRIRNRIEGAVKRLRSGRNESDVANLLMSCGNFGFTVNSLAIGELRSERDLRIRRWEDDAVDGQHLRGQMNRLSEILGDPFHRG